MPPVATPGLARLLFGGVVGVEVSGGAEEDDVGDAGRLLRFTLPAERATRFSVGRCAATSPPFDSARFAAEELLGSTKASSLSVDGGRDLVITPAIRWAMLELIVLGKLAVAARAAAVEGDGGKIGGRPAA
jgi:hypothetical protein